MKNPHKHHIIPVYHCKELGIDPDFEENYVTVERLDHARIHWGYKCDDLEPLFEYVTPAQWIIDLIPREDNRDGASAQLIALGEIDGIDMSGENSPNYKHGIQVGEKDWFNWPEENKERRRAYQRTPEYMEKNRIRSLRFEKTPERKVYKKKYDAERYARLKTETQSKGTLEGFLG